MKKIILLFIIITSFSVRAQINEDFESGTFPPTGWAVFDNGNGTVESWRDMGTANHIAFVKWEDVASGTAEDWLVTPQFTVQASEPLFAFAQGDFNNPNYGSTFTVRISTASQTTVADFTIIDTQDEAQLGRFANTHTIDLSSYVGQPIYVAFVWSQDDGDALAIDNVRMEHTYTAPLLVTTPSPADAAVDVAIDGGDSDGNGNPDNAVLFSWTPNTSGDPAATYKYYLGTSATSMSLISQTTNTSIRIINTAVSTTYYWKVVPVNNGGEATGAPTWSFTTAATASVKDENEQLFSIYPNPASDILSISSKVDLDNVSIINLMGQEVLGINEFDRNTNSFNISSLKKGVYFIKMSSNTKKQSIRFIKK